MRKEKETSWETSASWYDKAVGPRGHYYHQQVILPNLLRLANFDKKAPHSLLDLACGQGILSRHIPKEVAYVGVDASRSLIASAKKESIRPNCKFLVADLSKPLNVEMPPFTHAICLLAAQNIDSLETLFSTHRTTFSPAVNSSASSTTPVLGSPGSPIGKLTPRKNASTGGSTFI